MGLPRAGSSRLWLLQRAQVGREVVSSAQGDAVVLAQDAALLGQGVLTQLPRCLVLTQRVGLRGLPGDAAAASGHPAKFSEDSGWRRR